MKIKVASINVNGIRAATLTGKSAKFGYGLKEWIQSSKPDVIAIQELKAIEEEIEPVLDYLEIPSENFYMQSDLIKKGHAGVAVAVLSPNIKTINVNTPFEGIKKTEQYLTSGRWIELDLNVEDFTKNSEIRELTLISAYIHHADSPTATRKASKSELEKGSKKDVLVSREFSETTMNNKHNFMKLLTERIRELSSKNLIIAGDYNIAHQNCDIKNYSGNQTKAGFLPEERAWLDLWLAKKSKNSENDPVLKDAFYTFKYNPKIEYHTPKRCYSEFMEGGLGLHDVCRELWGKNKTEYTWWTYMGRAFDNNAGWRIDYQFASEHVARCAKTAVVEKQPSYSNRWTDHAPLMVEYNL